MLLNPFSLEARLRAADSLGLVLPTRALAPLIAAGACALSAVLVWLTAYHLTPFEAIDQRMFDGFLGLSRPATTQWATHLSHLADPGPFALFAAALVIVALARRAPRAAVAVAVILLGSNLTTQLLKPALALPQPFPGIDTATWPSGHATAAMSLVLCLQLVVPARLRPAAAALGGLLAVGIVYSILILGHHEPSDILGGLLVAGAWTGLVVAALRTAAPDRDPALRTAATLIPVALAATAVAAVASAFALAHWNGALDYAATHTTFMAGAAFIALGAMGMSAAASVALTRPGG
jgi:membrane-associated phospholipid phosphatase